MSYKGKGSFTEMNEETHTVRMVGDAREVGGSGSTKVTMVITVIAVDGGSSQVSVDADISLVGRIVQFGRGMIEEVSRQMFRQFSICVKSRLEVADEPPAQMATTNDADPTPIEAGTKTPPAEVKAVNATSLGLRALWAIIARFFKRLFGKSGEVKS
jgi:hypothetical protein